ncbi:HDL394Wp [Eremothecium sinecaudum]|uniref:HDL394Wp n=1 Tax=Eremothecium sinecaudum TaxID=45286 RepID=A0A0X8HRX7_9SACH|nr:HDL394Wp [Eremothecium sinecaudum]AMD20350.1 HDL394Wp [Eremothecium sinecaudum]
MVSIKWLLLIGLVRSVLGDVSIVEPGYLDKFSGASGSVKMAVRWKNDNFIYPYADQINFYNVTLCRGTKYGVECRPEKLAQNVDARKLPEKDGLFSVDVAIDGNVIGDGFFTIQLASSAGLMGYTIVYSKPFQLTDMKGSWDWKGEYNPYPVEEYQITADLQGRPRTYGAEYAKTAYRFQTGLTRFPPLQTQPPTKKTATTWVAANPSTSVSYFKTPINSIIQETTMSMSGPFITQVVNHVPPPSFPTDNGAAYNPKDRIKFTPKKVNYNQLATKSA